MTLDLHQKKTSGDYLDPPDNSTIAPVDKPTLPAPIAIIPVPTPAAPAKTAAPAPSGVVPVDITVSKANNATVIKSTKAEKGKLIHVGPVPLADQSCLKFSVAKSHISTDLD